VYGYPPKKRRSRSATNWASHPKLIAVSKAIAQVVAEGEKVVVFWITTPQAAEVAAELAEILGNSAKGAKGQEAKTGACATSNCSSSKGRSPKH